MKSFLFINLSGDFLSLHQRINKEGYDCYSYYGENLIKGKGNTGKEMIDIVPDFFDVLNKFKDKKKDLIILVDDNGQGDLFTYLHSEGWYTIGSSAFSDRAEHDRNMGNKIAKKIGLDVPPTEHFTDFNSVYDYLEKLSADGDNQPMFFKGDGLKMAGSSKTHYENTISGMVYYLNWLESDQVAKNYTIDSFELQTKIEGIELDVGAWFNGEKFLNNAALCFEQKKLDGKGAAQGCTGQIITFTPANKNKYFKDYFTKLQPILAKEGIANEWAINNIVDEETHMPYFLEFTPRFGWDSTFGELAILQDAGYSIADFFIKIATKTPFPRDYFPKNKFSAALRLFSESTGTSGMEVNGKPLNYPEYLDDNIWLYSVRKRGDYMELTDNPFAVITAVSDSPEKALKEVYAMVKLINTPDLTYSNTIGENISSILSTLNNWEVI